MEDERERKGEQLNFFQFHIIREFHKIHINRVREIIVQPLKGYVSSNGCVSSIGTTLLREIPTRLKGCLKKLHVKM